MDVARKTLRKAQFFDHGEPQMRTLFRRRSVATFALQQLTSDDDLTNNSEAIGHIRRLWLQ